MAVAIVFTCVLLSGGRSWPEAFLDVHNLIYQVPLAVCRCVLVAVRDWLSESRVDSYVNVSVLICSYIV